MRIVVIGAGAIGGGVGGLLWQAGVDVALVAGGPHLEAMRSGHLTVATPHGELCAKVPAFESPHDIEWRSGDIALLTTKLYDAERALDELLAAAGPDVPVACLQNGLPGASGAATRFETVYEAVVYVPAVMLRPGRVELHGAPTPGVIDCPSPPLARVLAAAGFDSRHDTDVVALKRGKLLTNLTGGEETQREAATVYEALGWNPVALLDGLRRRCGHVTLAPVAGRVRRGGSLWQSRVRGRPTELPWLNGAIVDLGERVGIPAPANRRAVATTS